MTKLEQVLADTVKNGTGIDVAAIIAAAQESVTTTATIGLGGFSAVETTIADDTPAKTVRRAKKTEQAPTEQAPTEMTNTPVAEPATAPSETATVKQETAETRNADPTPGINISGLFTGTGADKKVVKTVFLAAVEKAETLAALVALNDICDCGIDTSDGRFTEDTSVVLRKKLTRWGNAQD